MENTKGQPLAVIETRVSDPRQLDGSHAFQESECCILAAALNAEVPDDGIWNTTMSGSVEDRENFGDILKYIDSKKGRVKWYVAYSIERITRGGPAVYELMKKELRKRGVQMRDVEGVIQPDKNSMENLGFEYSWSRYSPSDTNELLEAGKGRDNKRVMLTRMIGQQIINVNEGYASRGAPDGMRNVTESYYVDGKRKKRSTRVRVPERAPYYEKLFELRVEGLKTDEEIANVINDMGYRSKVRSRWNKGRTEKIGTSGGILMTAKQLQQVVQRLSYAGVNLEYWTHGKPVRGKYSGLVSIDTWNKANRGRLFIKEYTDGTLTLEKNYVPEERTHGNPIYPYKDVVLCSICGKPFFGSASRGKSGQHHPAYHCTRKVDGVRHKRVSSNKETFEDNVEDFIHGLRFDTELWKSFELVLMDTFRQKQVAVTQAASIAGRRVTELQEQKAAATKAFIDASRMGDEGMKRDIQAERTRLEQEVQVAQGYRNTLEVTERELEDFMSRAEWVMEHPANFLLGARNKPQRLAYFSLMFDELPTYQDVIDGTPKLSWVFRLKDDSSVTESDNVRRAGFEPAKTEVNASTAHPL